MNKIIKYFFILLSFILLTSHLYADDSLYLYQENYFHWYSASGWMGNHNDLSLNSASSENPFQGNTCVKISYSPKEDNPLGWAGIYWQYPTNNWGEQSGRKVLNGMKRLTFYARGEIGGEVIIFKIGGIQGEQYSDSDMVEQKFTLSKKWKKYNINLKGKDLSHIIGGFLVLCENKTNPKGAIIFLDEIGYHK